MNHERENLRDPSASTTTITPRNSFLLGFFKKQDEFRWFQENLPFHGVILKFSSFEKRLLSETTDLPEQRYFNSSRENEWEEIPSIFNSLIELHSLLAPLPKEAKNQFAASKGTKSQHIGCTVDPVLSLLGGIMNTVSISALTLALAGALTASSAWAATNFGGNTAPSGAHYRQGAGEPVCTINGLTVSCTGTEIAGVGNTDADLVLSVTYSATVQCRNRGGNIVEVKTQTTSATSGDDLTDVRNGTLYVSPISVSAPNNQSFLNGATCPNGNWTKLLVEGSPSVASYTYTLTFHGFTEPAIRLP